MIAFADLPFVDCHFHMHMLIDQVGKANMHVSRDDPDKASVMDLMESCDLNAINIVSSTGAIGDEERVDEGGGIEPGLADEAAEGGGSSGAPGTRERAGFGSSSEVSNHDVASVPAGVAVCFQR